MLVNTDVYGDPRVMAERAALMQAGYAVTVIGAARRAGLPARDPQQAITLAPVVGRQTLVELLRSLGRWWRGDLGEVTTAPARPQTGLLDLVFFSLWCLRLGWRLPADVVHAHDLSPLPAAWLLARRHRARLVYDSHESAPDMYGGFKGRAMAWLERRFIRRPQVVLTVGDRLAAALRARGARRVEVVGNWKRLEDFTLPAEQMRAERQRLGLSDSGLVVCYLGGLQVDRLILPLLEAVARSPEVALLVAGRGELSDQVAEAAERHPNIRWLGWLDMTGLAFYTSLSDVVYYCLSGVADHGNNYYSAPNKLFEALAAGKPVIARRGVGEIGDILERTGAGLLLDEVTPETLRRAFEQLQQPAVRDRLAAAARAAREQYNWSAAADRLLGVYAELVNDATEARS